MATALMFQATDWGVIFVTYWPYKQKSKIVTHYNTCRTVKSTPCLRRRGMSKEYINLKDYPFALDMQSRNACEIPFHTHGDAQTQS